MLHEEKELKKGKNNIITQQLQLPKGVGDGGVEMI